MTPGQGQVKRVEHYYYVPVTEPDGLAGEWLLTESEVFRIRERAARKVSLLPHIKAMPVWKRNLLRVLGIL